MKLAKLGLVSVLTAAALFGGTYNVDKSHSNVGFKVKHLMISNVSGKFDKFKGSFEYDEKTNTLKSLNGTIKVSSINTEDKKRDDHLKSADFFDVKKYPNITFKLKEIKGDKAHGEFTMHGVTKNIALDFENNGTVTDPWGNKRVGLELSGKLNRKDYGVSWNKAIETGGIVVGNKIKLTIDLEGILAK
jgi:polyisoprenoid-binding protein YceI